MKHLAWLFPALAAAAAALLAGAPASAADMVRVDRYESGICANRNVLGTISHRFDHQVRHVPGLPQVGIVDFYGARETRYLPQTERHPIARRYCSATVQLSDGAQRTVWYLIEYGMGFASLGANVEFCVSGFDRWHVYNGSCRVLR